ncbi:DUF4038 domain-containing protein [Paenibacillus sp. 1P07SE]|uniref:apiosidase-like domain-containing protein n=1 Tax=Paenibacillus sp. 1P07SE TaxID=3132209 RepID=UPI0039A6992B
MKTTKTWTWHKTETELHAARAYSNPYLDVTVTCTLTSPDGNITEVPAFWDGGSTWRVRFAPTIDGIWHYRTSSSEPLDSGLHGVEGTVDVRPYEGGHPLYRHGFLRAGRCGRSFVHQDGTRFFWLGDTAWAASSRASMEEWTTYLNYRSWQNYTVVQMNALPQWDATEADTRLPFRLLPDGQWDLTRPEPAYFQMLDEMIAQSVRRGIVVALTALWCSTVPGANRNSAHLKRPCAFTTELAARYGSYLSARYAAYGVSWLVTGDSDYEEAGSIDIYESCAVAIRRDAPHGLMTAHLHGGLPTPDNLNERAWLDFHMFQSCHVVSSPAVALRYAEIDRKLEPARPVLNGEPCYEGFRFFSKRPDPGTVDRRLVRQTAWSSILGGANAGYTYGAHGIWNWHRQGEGTAVPKYGDSPAWDEAVRLPGSDDIAEMKRLLDEMAWWRLEPMPSDELTVSSEGAAPVAAADREGRQVVAYFPERSGAVLRLKAKRLCWIDPVRGFEEVASWQAEADTLVVDAPSWTHDAVLIAYEAEVRAPESRKTRSAIEA